METQEVHLCHVTIHRKCSEKRRREHYKDGTVHHGLIKYIDTKAKCRHVDIFDPAL